MYNSARHLINNASVTQITRGHRLVEHVQKNKNTLYSASGYHDKNIFTDADYWLDSFIPKILEYTDDIIHERTQGLLHRLNKNKSLYNFSDMKDYQKIVEFFYDVRFFRSTEKYLPRKKLYRVLENIIKQDKKLNLAVPMLYLKPYSPLKNKGQHADLAELFTLINFKIIASIANYYSPTGAKVTILADGNKYNRSCLTPSTVVELYQRDIKYWIKKIGAEHLIDCVDYEKHVTQNLSEFENYMRNKLYVNNCEFLADKYNRFFNVHNIKETLAYLENLDDVGYQLTYTFLSKVTSVNYEILRNFVKGYSGDIQEDLYNSLYNEFIFTLYHDIRNISFYDLSKKFGVKTSEIISLFITMRASVWNASKRYVAISLTDRNLNIVNRTVPDLVKFTIHPKIDEIGVVSTNSKYVTMLAHHCTGGLELSKNGVKASYKYRCIREQEGEVPVSIKPIPDNAANREKYGPLLGMSNTQQPLGYIAADLTDKLDSLTKLFDKKFI